MVQTESFALQPYARGFHGRENQVQTVQSLPTTAQNSPWTTIWPPPTPASFGDSVIAAPSAQNAISPDLLIILFKWDLLCLPWSPPATPTSPIFHGFYPCCCCLVASGMSDSLQPHGLQPARLLCPWDSPGKNTAVGCHAVLQGIFPTQGSNPDFLHCRQILYCWASREAPDLIPIWHYLVDLLLVVHASPHHKMNPVRQGGTICILLTSASTSYPVRYSAHSTQ